MGTVEVGGVDGGRPGAVSGDCFERESQGWLELIGGFGGVDVGVEL